MSAFNGHIAIPIESRRRKFRKFAIEW